MSKAGGKGKVAGSAKKGPGAGKGPAKASGPGKDSSAHKDLMATQLQALVLADSFDEYFRPVTYDLPRCLMPVLNAPILSYTLEALVSQGIEEIFIFCCAHAEKVEKYIKALQLQSAFPDINLRVLTSRQSQSVGDALREVYQIGVMRDDFVLVYGDVLTTVALRDLVAQHSARRMKDKQAIMTLLLAQHAPAPSRSAFATLREPQPADFRHLLRSHPTAALPSTTAATTSKAAPPAAKKSSGEFSDGDYSDDDDEAAANSEGSLSSDPPPKATDTSRKRSDSLDSDYSDDSGDGKKSEESGEDSARAGLSLDYPSALDTAPEDDEDDDELRVMKRGEAATRRIVALDGESGQLLLYLADHPHRKSKAHKAPLLELDLAIVEAHPKLVFRDDVEDTGIAVCSAEVLSQFQDNFDYQTISRLIRGVVNEEILSCKIFAHLDTSGKYSGRVSSLRRYMQVHFDLLQRWTFPFVADANLVYSLLPVSPKGRPGSNGSAIAALAMGGNQYFMPALPTFQYVRDTKGGSGYYREKNVRISRTALISGWDLTATECAIGEGTTIGPNTRIVSSVIGRNCKIGSNVVLKDCLVWDEVEVGDGVELTASLLCCGVVVGPGSKATLGGGGCVLSFNVKLPANTSLPPLTKLLAPPPAEPSPRGKASPDVQASAPPSQLLQPVPWIEWIAGGVPSGTSVAAVVWASAPKAQCELTTGWETLFAKPSQAQPKSKKPSKSTGKGKGKSRAKVSGESIGSESSDSDDGTDDDFSFKDQPSQPQPTPLKTSATSTKSNPAGGAKSGTSTPKMVGSGSSATIAPAKASAVPGALKSSGTSDISRSSSKLKQSSSSVASSDMDELLGNSDMKRFRAEVQGTVVRAVKENHSLDNLRLEINSLKYAYNQTFLECATCIFHGLMECVDQTKIAESVKATIKKWGKILHNFLHTPDDFTEFVFSVQDFCEEKANDKFAKIFQTILMQLYETGVLDEAAIFKWADEQKQNAEGEDLRLFNQCKKFLEWLAEAEEDSDAE